MVGSPATLPAPDLPAGRRLALVVATTRYADTTLRQLRAPARDAADLRDLLADPKVGGFAVTSVVDGTAQRVRLALEEFLAGREPDDLLLVYLSCHGLVDLRRRLYFAATDTLKDRLASTGVEAQWLLEQLEDCRARRQVVLLDCCFSGAFAHRAKADTDLGLGERFHGQGRGRVVLTASRASEYSFEGEPVPGSAMPGSVFTSALVAGIRTGAADGDNDGYISVDDAYGYAFDHIRAAGAQQTPQRWLFGAEGTILLARSPAGVTVTPADLPTALRTGLDSSLPTIRLGAVAALGEWLADDDPARVQAARHTLTQIADTDVPSVATAAQSLLDTTPPPGKPTVAPAADTRRARARRGWPRRPQARRLVYATAAAVVLAAAGIVAAVLIPQGGDSGGEDHPTSGVFTATAPWRLAIRNDSSAEGCTVSVTKTDTGEKKIYDNIHGEKSFQMQLTGTLRWEANDSGCLVVQRTGPGKATLPYSLSEYSGDSDAFAAPKTPGKVTVTVREFQSSQCNLVLRDARDGRNLDFGSVARDGNRAVLDPNGRSLVYLAATDCLVTITAG
jgi:Caspase domain